MIVTAARRPALTAGRTIFNCSVRQFEAYRLNPHVAPRMGVLLQAMEVLGCEMQITHEGLHLVRKKETPFDPAEPSIDLLVSGATRSAAAHAWWASFGLNQVISHRQDHREWEHMPKPGRVKGYKPSEVEVKQRRSAVRENAQALLVSLWDDVAQYLRQQHPHVETWVMMAEDRELPRRNCMHRVTPKRAKMDALRQVYDIDKLNSFGIEYPDKSLQANYMACLESANVSALMGRAALDSALLLSPTPGDEILLELQRLLEKHGLTTIDNLREIFAQAY